MINQAEEFKKLSLYNEKKISNLTCDDIKKFLKIILNETEKVHDSLNKNINVRYVAMTSLNIHQYLSSLENLSNYLKKGNKNFVNEKNKEEIIRVMDDLCEISNKFYNAVFYGTVYESILRLEELQFEMAYLLNLCD